MPGPPVPISQPPDSEFLYNWLLSLTASATPGGAVNAVQYKAGAAAFGGVGPLANGELLIGTGGAPVAAALTAGTGISISVASGSITIDATGSSSGITELTGDVTAGPGSGSQVAALANTAVAPGSYTYSSITVDAKGRLTAAASGAAPVAPPTPANPTAQVGPVAINGAAATYMRSDAAPKLADTAVVAGSYTYGAFTVDAQGRLTAAASGAAPPSSANPTATVSGSVVNGAAATFMRSDAAPALANTAVTPGAYTNSNLTVDAQGRITAAANGSVPSPGGADKTIQFNNAGAFGGIGPLTNGQIVIGSTGATSVAGSLTQPAAGLTITAGAGTITLALADDLAAVEGLATTGLAARTGTSTWATRTLTGPAAGITVSNGGGVAGDPTLALANDLAALEAMSGTGIVARTASETYAQRTITGTASRISLSNGDGVAGNPTIDIDTAYVGQTSIVTLGTVTTGTWSATTIAVNKGGTGQTSYTDGQLLIGNSTGNTLAKASLTQPAAGITITGGSGTITFALGNDLAALEAMSGTGLVARTAAETYAQRTITGTASRLTVTNGDGVAGNPTLDISASYVGQATITTLGTIGTGTWNGSVVAGQFGGTGVANTGFTITLAGNLATAGAFATTLTATAATNATLPAGTHTLAGLDVAQTWSANQQFNSGNLLLKGATSGTITLNAAAIAGSNTLTLPAGTTDLSATGGTSQVLKQTGAGAAITVGQLAASDLSGGIATTNGLLKGDGTGAITAATFEQDFGLPVPALDLDFTTALYWNAPNNPNNPFTFTRASAAYISSDGTDAGTWTQVASNVLRRNSVGALIEETRTNSERNNSMQGAVAGSPGTIPTNWNIATVPTGLTRTIALGSTNGVDYIEFNYAGTATSTAAPVVSLDAATGIAAANGDIIAGSSWFSNSVTTGITAILFRLQVLDSGGLNLATTNLVTGLNGSTRARIGGTATVANASTAFARLQFVLNSITNGTVCNFTFRIEWPQQEKVTDSSFTYSSPIRTTGAAATRAADVLDVNLPSTFGTSYTLRARGTPQYATAYNADQYAVTVSDGTSANRFALLRLAATAIPQWIINSTKTAIGASAWAGAANKRVAAANAVSSQAGSFDGGAIATGGSATSPAGLTKVSIGHDGTGASQFNGYIQHVYIWPGVRLGNQAVVSIAAANLGGRGYASSLDYGTTTNDDAAAGHVGEFVSSVVLVGSAVPLTTATAANVTSISLTAGDWDVDGEVWFNEAASTVATIQIGAITTTSATLPTTPSTSTAMTKESATTVTGTGSVLKVGPARMSLSATTTVFLVAQATFTVSTNGAYGALRARRIR